MVCIESGLYVRIVEMQGERSPQPRPLSNGFSPHVAYRVIGLHSASETSEAYLILSNDRDELWFISNKHARSLGVAAARAELRVPLDRWSGAQTPFSPTATGRAGRAGTHPSSPGHAPDSGAPYPEPVAPPAGPVLQPVLS